MKKKFWGIISITILLCAVFTACSSGSTTGSHATPTPSSSSTYSSKSYGSSGSSSYSGSSGSSKSSYSNKYGTSTTKCAKPGCNNYIASSGDTNCCVTHSNKCLNCRKYIDGDATYCLSCLYDSVKKSSGSSSSGSYSGSSGKSSSKSSNKCYICGDKAYSKYGSYYYCSDCLKLVKSFSK